MYIAIVVKCCLNVISIYIVKIQFMHENVKFSLMCYYNHLKLPYFCPLALNKKNSKLKIFD